MKKWLAVFGTIIAYILTVGLFFTNKVMYIRKKSDEELLMREKAEGFYVDEVYETLEKKPFSIPSPFGYLLKGNVIEQHNTKKFIIFCHGVTVHSINSIKYMNIFLERGWNVILYDHRRHGQSEGKTTSYGHYEKFDLKAIIDWTKNRFGQDIILGIHGESMGASTTLLYAGMIEDGADFYIADCPFSDLEEQLRYRLKEEFRLPGQAVLPIANIFLKLRDGYSLKDVSPIQFVDHIQNPVLFIHSAQDDYILPRMTKELYEKKPGPKALYYAPFGTHARSYAENRSDYEKVIDDFLEKFNIAKRNHH
ncbi:alpha/beta hydrolase [Priestia abyssalis]|uniref:alpha/beta hydrolase n=1 Tax=Priestia abyssalis TaxID=1221450 RepID=UPI0009959AE9|nr:alpha/beta hydrolase [Priestia abyssalis]